MKDNLEAIEAQVAGKKNLDSPPLHLWNPPLSGDIDIVIRGDGSWCHEGGRIERQALVNLFARILRREDDGHYYLVTPVEKWRIQVELHPLIITDIDQIGEGEEQILRATLNTGAQVEVGEGNPLFLEPDREGTAALRLPHGLSALFSRPAWYRLVDIAQQSAEGSVVQSGRYRFDLAQPA